MEKRLNSQLTKFIALSKEGLEFKCFFVVVDVAQLVRAPGCGSGGRRFKTGLPPHFS